MGEVEADEIPSSLTLKLSLSSGFMRYFVISETHNRVIFFGEYKLHHITGSADLENAAENIIEKDEILKLPFGKVIAGFDGSYSLSPAAFPLMDEVSERMCCRCGDVDLTFECADNLVHLFKRRFGNPSFLHLNSVYLRLLPQYLDEIHEPLFINVGQQFLDIIRFMEDKKLQFMNRYSYAAVSDFIYFVLLCCEELKMDRERCTLMLMGEVDIQSGIYDICYRYFRSIAFIPKPGDIHFSRSLELYPKHLHFNLYNLGE